MPPGHFLAVRPTENASACGMILSRWLQSPNGSRQRPGSEQQASPRAAAATTSWSTNKNISVEAFRPCCVEYPHASDQRSTGHSVGPGDEAKAALGRRPNSSPKDVDDPFWPPQARVSFHAGRLLFRLRCRPGEPMTKRHHDVVHQKQRTMDQSGARPTKPRPTSRACATHDQAECHGNYSEQGTSHSCIDHEPGGVYQGQPKSPDPRCLSTLKVDAASVRKFFAGPGPDGKT